MSLVVFIGFCVSFLLLTSQLAQLMQLNSQNMFIFLWNVVIGFTMSNLIFSPNITEYVVLLSMFCIRQILNRYNIGIIVFINEIEPLIINHLIGELNLLNPLNLLSFYKETQFIYSCDICLEEKNIMFSKKSFKQEESNECSTCSICTFKTCSNCFSHCIKLYNVSKETKYLSCPVCKKYF